AFVAEEAQDRRRPAVAIAGAAAGGAQGRARADSTLMGSLNGSGSGPIASAPPPLVPSRRAGSVPARRPHSISGEIQVPPDKAATEPSLPTVRGDESPFVNVDPDYRNELHRPSPEVAALAAA